MARMLLSLIVATTVLWSTGCALFSNTNEVIPVQFLASPTGEQRRLVIVLPGRGDNLSIMRRSGIVDAIQRGAPDVDVLLTEMSMRYYVEGRAMERLHKEVVLPAKARYSEIYLAGASLGGMGALLYEREHPGEMTGLILMAPYMGDPAITNEIKAAGGLAQWTAGEPAALLVPNNASREEWRVVRSLLEQPRASSVWLICGQDDRFFADANLVAEALPPSHFIQLAGGHKWTVWSQGAALVFDRIGAAKQGISQKTNERRPQAASVH